MASRRSMLFLSDHSSSTLAHAPTIFEELLRYLERLYHIPTALIQLHTEKQVPVSSQAVLDLLVQQEISVLTLCVSARTKSEALESDYILGFEDRRKLRLVRVEDNVVSCLESEVMHWTGRACLYGADTVLFTGGQEDPKSAHLISIADPTHSTELESMQEGRLWHGLCTIGSKAYVLGGKDPVSGAVKRSSEFLENGTWTLLSPLNFPRESMAVTSHKGVIYVVGGFNGVSRLASIEAYKLKSWVMLPVRLPEPRQMAGIMFLEDTKLMVVGGQDEDRAKKSVFLLSLDTGKVSTWPALPVPDYFTGRQLVRKPSGEVWGFGKQTYIYFPQLQMWATASNPTRVTT